MNDQEAFDWMEASQLTVDLVVSKIGAMGPNPRADHAQAMLDLIAKVQDRATRDVLFATAKQGFKDPAIKSLVGAASKAANQDAKGKQREPFQKADSSVPLPPWASNGYGKHGGRTYAWGVNKEGEPTPLHTPLNIRTGLIYPDRIIQGREQKTGVLIEFEKNEAGELCTLPYTRADALLAPKEGLIADLANAGVLISPAGIDAIRNGILERGASGFGGILYDFPGWRDGIFVTPGGEVIGESNQTICLAHPLPDVRRKGTLEGWLKATAPAFGGEILAKAPHVAATVIWGFVSPLIDLAKEEMSLVLCITGRTSKLKTFGQRAMASVWGGIDTTAGILVTFSSTVNRLEEYAIERSGCGLPIDESTLIDGKAIVSFVYRIVTGAERGRKGEKARRWRVACVISSELPLEQLARDAGSEPPPGLMSRVLQIPVIGDRVSDGPVNIMRAVADPKHVQHFGHAGPKFVQAVIDREYDQDSIVSEVGQRIAKLLGGTGDQEQHRRASRALGYLSLAADIAQKSELIPADFDIDGFISRLWEMAKGSADTTTTVVARVRSALAEGLRSGTIPIYSSKGDALSTGGTGAVCIQELGPLKLPAFVLPAGALAKMIGIRETVKDAAKILDQEGLILREQEDRLTWRPGRAGVGNVPGYAIYARDVLGDDAVETIERHRSVRAQAPDRSNPENGG